MRHDPIFITGVPRSQTSFVASIIDAHGVFGGEVLGPTRNNKAGQYENREIINTVIKPILAQSGYDPKGQNPLPETSELSMDNYHAFSHISEIMLRHGLKDDQMWYIKDPKLCLVWTLLYMSFSHAKWVIVRRYKEDVISSCMNTGFMNSFSTREEWSEWFDQYMSILLEIEKYLPNNFIEVWPCEAIQEGDLSQMHDMIDWLGLKWNKKAVKSRIHKEYNHHYLGS